MMAPTPDDGAESVRFVRIIRRDESHKAKRRFQTQFGDSKGRGGKTRSIIRSWNSGCPRRTRNSGAASACSKRRGSRKGGVARARVIRLKAPSSWAATPEERAAEVRAGSRLMASATSSGTAAARIGMRARSEAPRSARAASARAER